MNYTRVNEKLEAMRAVLEGAKALKTEDGFYDLPRSKQKAIIDDLALKLDTDGKKPSETPKFRRAIDALYDEWEESFIESLKEWAFDRAWEWMEDRARELELNPPEDARDTAVTPWWHHR